MKNAKIFLLSLMLRFLFDIGIIHAAESAPQRLTIDFCIIDAKYDGKHLKILEFGSGPRSGLDGYHNLYGVGSLWTQFWQYLDQFKKPMWYMKTPKLASAEGKRWFNFMAGEKLIELGGRFALDPHEVEQHVSQFCTKKSDGNYPDYNGIFLMNISRNRPECEPMNAQIRKMFPAAVFVNDISDNFVFNKSKSDRLFREDGLREFRPKSMVCMKRYSSGLARKIIGTMQCDLFVIKPLNAQYGKGVIFVRKEELDTILQAILTQKNLDDQEDRSKQFHKRTSRIPLCEAIDYWSTDNNSRFIIEEYVPSKLIEVEGKRYDATLRVIFAMHCLNRQITITSFGGYWKLPTHAVDDEGSLNDIHQSYQYDRSIISAAVDQTDMDHINELLKMALTPIYAKMIAQIKK